MPQASPSGASQKIATLRDLEHLETMQGLGNVLRGTGTSAKLKHVPEYMLIIS